MSHEILTPKLLDKIDAQSRAEQSEYLFLEPSEEFRGCWEVDALWPEWFIDLEPIVGNYRLVTPAGLDNFLKATNQGGYRVVFVDEPTSIIDAYRDQMAEPVVSLESSLPHTVRGFLPWQVVGFNKLVKDESIRAGYVVWDTGAGKTAFIASAMEYHFEFGHEYSLALVVVKSHNKIDTQRKLLKMTGVNSLVIDGPREKRYKLYQELEYWLRKSGKVVAITNYEKFREDTDVFKSLFKQRDCLFFWDEMPSKLSNRNTQLYRAVKKSLYESFHSKPRPRWMRHFILTATPIENSPEDVFSCVNLTWPGLLGSVGDFYSTYVAAFHPLSRKPVAWKNLDRLEAKLGFMTHRVSKDDPEVAAMFPEAIALPKVIDWSPKHKSIYDKLTGKAQGMADELAEANILALIQIMQMVCDAPSMIRQSAENREAFSALLSQLEDMDEAELPLSGPRGSEIAVALLRGVDQRLLTDVGHTKLAMWREIITEKHPHDKIVTHSTWANYIFPVWEYWLREWGVNYVIYNGTSKQKQYALDNFRRDPDIRVFLSGDAGSDSIDIPEARVGVNYNIPWKWTSLKQREGRRDRVNSTFDTIYTYTLVMADSVDERKLDICDRKYQYHASLFDGRAMEEAISASMSREDLLYILTGSRPSPESP